MSNLSSISPLDSISIVLEDYVGNKNYQTIVYLFLILYIAIIAPRLSHRIVKKINNVYVKLFGLIIIIILGQYDITTSVLFAIAFIISLHSANKVHINTVVQGVLDNINQNKTQTNYGVTKEINDINSNIINQHDNQYDIYNKKEYSNYFETDNITSYKL